MYGPRLKLSRIHSEPADTLLSLHELAMIRIETPSLMESIANVLLLHCTWKFECVHLLYTSICALKQALV